VQAVAEPHPGDRVLESDGARVYLDDVADPRVEGHVLDAVTEDTGRVQFVVKDR
jgi:Fe-S cluster assembly iron-binding protein IscA